MKLFFLTLASLAFAAAPNAALKEVRTVYLLPMAGSLDQYLAVRLTASSLLLVVTDPQKADAIFTDRIGTGFEEALAEIYPPPKKDAKEKDKDPYVRPASKMPHGKGSFFLVDRKTREVLWSSFEKPAGTQNAADLDKLAGRITAKLEKELRGK